mgnify:CR=1 FL=1
MVSGRVSLDAFLEMDGVDERRLELLDGEVQESPEAGPAIGAIVSVLGERLQRFGTVIQGARVLVPRSAQFADSSLLPKLIYYRTNPPAEFNRVSRPPDVAVEAVAPNQSRVEMRTRVAIYLAFGVPSVWVIDPERQLVDMYEDGERQTLTGEETLETPWAPGFSLSIEELFRGRPVEAASS